MLLLYAIGWILGIILTLFTYYKKTKRFKSLISKVYGKEKSKEVEAGKEGNHKGGTTKRSR